MSHYDTLGVPPDADQATIRAAYRRLARRYHPDSGSSDPTAMAAVNEAYRVLREPARRALYDASLRAPTVGAQPRSAARSAPSAPPRPHRPPVVSPPTGPPRFPWKLVAFMFSVGALAVLVLAALREPSPPPPADGLLEPGSCVEIEPNGDAREVVCVDGATQRVVTALVPTGDPCPNGTEAHRDRQGRGTACLEPVPSIAGS